MFSDKQYYLFTDASVSCQNGFAVGAFLFLSNEQLKQFEFLSKEEIDQKVSKDIIYKKFETRKSTFAEMETVRLALDSFRSKIEPQAFVHIYTDCENLCYLLGGRKEKLINSSFKSQSGKDLAHKDIYIELFKKSQIYKLVTHKIKGHAKNSLRLSLEDKIFSFIDKRARKRMRQLVEVKKEEFMYA